MQKCDSNRFGCNPILYQKFWERFLLAFEVENEFGMTFQKKKKKKKG